MPAWASTGSSKNRTSTYAFSNNPNAQADSRSAPYPSSSQPSPSYGNNNTFSQHARSDSEGRSTGYNAAPSFAASPTRDLHFPNNSTTSTVQMPNVRRTDSSESNFHQTGYAGSREGGMPLLGAGGAATRDSSISGHSDFSPPNSRRYAPSASRGSIAGSVAPSVSEQYDLPVDPTYWQHDMNQPEADDYLHNPDPKRDLKNDRSGTIFTSRGIANLGCLALIATALLMLFAGYPIISEFTKRSGGHVTGSFNLGGVNASGQVPMISGVKGMIDPETPTSAYSITSREGTEWELVFSDEFNTEGRTFWPGDDPYWEAIDLHAWGTNDLEWYDPRQVTTKDGKLVLQLAKQKKNNLDYVGASIQTWNKFCFQGGRLEASVQLPAKATVAGLWPAFWTMGNLGRVGYGGTLDGLWPYSYDECDAGTLPNQTNPLTGLPEIAKTSGTDQAFNYALSYLPGQRLSRCTCENDKTHPGPKHPDGSFVGRSAPEIDVFEAQVAEQVGEVSLSAQWAPFNPGYVWNNASYMTIADPDVTHLNSYQGGVYQQTSSGVAITNQDCYEINSAGVEGCYAVYGYEYKTGSDGYIAWFSDNKFAWEYREGGFAAVPEADVGNRHIPDEPLYILFNLAISNNFGWIDFDSLEALWPVEMKVDYMRFYQDPSRRAIGCDPDDHPTAEYIKRYEHAYTNPNITTWDQMSDDPLPLNKLTSPSCPANTVS